MATAQLPALTATLEPRRAFTQLSDLLASGHWMGRYIVDLLNAPRRPSPEDFTTAEKLLAKERLAFERDLAIARKMYKLYPQAVTNFL